MQPEIRTLVDVSDTEAARRGQADIWLARAHWAASAFQRYDRRLTNAIVDAVSEVAHTNAEKYGTWAVEETGFGIAEHKKQKCEMTAKEVVAFYRDQDFVNPRFDVQSRIVEIPRPAGVVFALTPSTNPIATLVYKVLLALMTRNAIVISPHPGARECSVDMTRVLYQAALNAGAPDGVIQIIEKPSVPMIETLMSSPRTNLIIATGGDAVVRAAYSSSNPAIGVGPGNAPILVDSSADIKDAGQHIVEGGGFDNSVLCTSESVIITVADVEKPLKRAMESSGAYICDESEVARIRDFLFHERGFNIEAVGRDATWIAQECDINVPRNTRILLAPITHIGVEEKLSTETLCPVLSLYVAENRDQAMEQARAVLRLTGAGHSAAIHTTDQRIALEYATKVEAYRVVVNTSCSQGAAGFGTHLAPTFTVGTGYFGRSSIGENVGPQHLVHWTRLAHDTEVSESLSDYTALAPEFEGALPPAPADGVPGSPAATSPAASSKEATVNSATRDELRRLIAEELRGLLRK